jgi:hypothetical protein
MPAMKKFASLLVVCAAVAILGASEKQEKVMPALESLKLEKIPELFGEEIHYKVTKETVDYLERLRKEGRELVLDRDGSIREKR